MYVSLFVCFYVCLSVCLFLFMSVFMSVCLFVCLFQVQTVTLDSLTILLFVSLRSLLCLSCLTITVSLHCDVSGEDLAVLSSWIKQ